MTVSATFAVRAHDAGSSFIEVGFYSPAFAWRPAGECGRASWGRYLGARWLGFHLLCQRFRT